MKTAKQFLTLLLAAMLACSLAACQQAAPSEGTSEPSTSGYTPGTYQASATGMNGLVNVSVTFDETSITEIVIGENVETISISKPALTRVPQDIVEYQTLNVDLASGATISSNAVITAVADAVTQAGGDAAALKAAPKPDKGIQEDATLTTDIVVVGSGLTGVSAALEAANQGKNVILIEKMEAYGGSSAQS